ncbi:adhesive plaque matrix protein-like [Palaemon carinicauda]|uniref:adhesive plaque matrix protein-like n=1 Tax=Palaemon carinicauda TaxID=392227 RepID=UPI0035B5FE8F
MTPIKHSEILLNACDLKGDTEVTPFPTCPKTYRDNPLTSLSFLKTHKGKPPCPSFPQTYRGNPPYLTIPKTHKGNPLFHLPHDINVISSLTFPKPNRCNPPSLPSPSHTDVTTFPYFPHLPKTHRCNPRSPTFPKTLRCNPPSPSSTRYTVVTTFPPPSPTHRDINTLPHLPQDILVEQKAMSDVVPCHKRVRMLPGLCLFVFAGRK